MLFTNSRAAWLPPKKAPFSPARTGKPADNSHMKDTDSSSPVSERTAWLEGYRAAIADAVAIVDSLGGPNFQNLSAPVLLRLKSRLVELEGRQDNRAA